MIIYKMNAIITPEHCNIKSVQLSRVCNRASFYFAQPFKTDCLRKSVISSNAQSLIKVTQFPGAAVNAWVFLLTTSVSNYAA